MASLKTGKKNLFIGTMSGTSADGLENYRVILKPVPTRNQEGYKGITTFIVQHFI